MEELPELPEIRLGHACAALPATGVRPAQTNPHFKPLNLQAFVVAGGTHSMDTYKIPPTLSSVLTLLPGATAWTPLLSLPRTLLWAEASIVGGRIRVTAGFDGDSMRSEVITAL